MNKPDTNTVNATAVMIAGMGMISEKLDAIDEKVTKKIAYLKVENALKLFRAHILKNHKKPRNFDYILEQFNSKFAGGNLAVINSYEVEEFLTNHWGNSAKSTFNARLSQLQLLFNFCIKEQKRRNAPVFSNPVDLVDPAKNVPQKEHEYVEPEKIVELIKACSHAHHALWLKISLSGGLRVSELLKLTPRAIDGRTLTLFNPKSGADFEVAVIPEKVADRLQSYIKKHGIKPNQKIWPATHSTSINKFVRRHTKMAGIKNWTTHSLRKECSTFWNRLGENGAMRFVLRHHSSGNLTALEGRYIAPLKISEMELLQDKHMDFF